MQYIHEMLSILKLEKCLSFYLDFGYALVYIYYHYLFIV